MRVVDIIPGTTVDGPGMRTSIYFAGCRHECPGCHNPLTWSFKTGREMTVEEVMSIIKENDFDVTFTGGDPLYSVSEILPLAKAVKEAGYSLWIYTGFLFEETIANKEMAEIIKTADVLVDGPYIESQRDTKLSFRGSSNQRIIDVSSSIKTGETVIMDFDYRGINIVNI